MTEHNSTSHKDIISFYTSEDWNVDEWQRLLASLSNIYNVFISLKIIKQFNTDLDDRFEKITVEKIISNPSEFIDEESKLKIHEIKISSPGVFSLIGNGEIIKELRKLICSIMKRKINKEKAIIENNIKKEILFGEKLKNIKTYLELMERYPDYKEICKEDQKVVINNLMYFDDSCIKYSGKAKLIEKQ